MAATSRRASDSQTRRIVRPEVKEPIIALWRAADQMRTSFDAVFGPYGITGQQYNVLRILRGAEPEGLHTLTIADRMIERAPGITRMIDRLEAKGLVARERCGEDRRCVYCRITGKGLELLKKLDRPVDEVTQAAFAALNPQELAQLVKLLERVRMTHEAA